MLIYICDETGTLFVPPPYFDVVVSSLCFSCFSCAGGMGGEGRCGRAWCLSKASRTTSWSTQLQPCSSPTRGSARTSYRGTGTYLTYVLVHPKRHKSVVVSSGSGGGLHHLFCHPMFVWMFSCLCNWLPELEMSVDISVKRNIGRPRICDETCQVHTFGS